MLSADGTLGERVVRSRFSGPVRRAVVLGAAVLGLTACGVGTWQSNPTPSPIRAVHAAVLQNGKVLLVSGSGNDRNAFAAGTFKTSVWDPIANTFTSVDTPWDAFCAGHAQLPDGRLLVAGGTAGYEQPSTANTFSGSRKAYAFNPDTNTYERVPSMDTGRWYPTLVTMGNGSVLAVAGQDASGRLTSTSQLFTGSDWNASVAPPVRDDLAPGTTMGWPLYPGLHLLADGRLFYSGSHTFGTTMPPGVWDVTNGTMHGITGIPDLGHTDHAMSVLLPPAQDQKVMIIGGGRDNGTPSTETTAIADLSRPNPRYTQAASLDAKKMYVSAVILPDRTVFETGGASKERQYGNAYVYSSQIFDPQTGTWTKAKDSTVPRGYHSSAILLPDGRVATFGNNPADNSFEMRIEIYSPEYLNKGTRPQITNVTNDIGYGDNISMTTTQTTPIKYVSLIRPMAVTHSVDANQRLVDVPFTTGSDGTLHLSVTDNPNLAPPGWYMLFATDTTGVPSVASWVHVGSHQVAGAPADDPPGDIAVQPVPGDPVTGG
jgi:Galactose oxidase-like, Early set domain/Galactose oxidase, central domain